MSLELRPINQRDAFEYITRLHRHHQAPPGGLWWHAVHCDEGLLRGVAIVGRPVARNLDDGLTSEVTRVCTDGYPNACSMLYGAARRVSVDKGFRRGLTYILAEEDGASLRAAGYEMLWAVKGQSWDRPGRPRSDKHPTTDKVAYGWGGLGATGREERTLVRRSRRPGISLPTEPHQSVGANQDQRRQHRASSTWRNSERRSLRYRHDVRAPVEHGDNSRAEAMTTDAIREFDASTCTQ